MAYTWSIQKIILPFPSFVVKQAISQLCLDIKKEEKMHDLLHFVFVVRDIVVRNY